MADLERKIHAIYHALDVRNWKRGIQAADAVLSRWKGNAQDVQIVHVLKGVALVYAGRVAEGIEACEVVRTADPPATDDHVLSTMMIVYKAANKVPLMAPAYEAAIAAEPSQELHRQLFAIYIRCSDLVKQQQVAMKLNRVYGGLRYVWWVVVVIAQNARAALQSLGSAMNPSQLLKLAEGMIIRQIENMNGKLNSYEELLMYLDILHAQKQHEEALEVVRGPLGSVISMESDRALLEGHCLERMGNVAAAATLYKERLQENPDDWAMIRLFLDCCLPSTRSGGLGQESHRLVGVQGGVEEAVGFDGCTDTQNVLDIPGDEAAAAVVHLLPLSKTGCHLVRGSALSSADLAARRWALASATGANTEEATAQLAEAVLAYFQLACTKVSCAPDLRPFVKVLQQSRQHAEVVGAELQRLAANPVSGRNEPPGRAQKYELRERVAAYQLRHDLCLLNSPGQAQELMELYSATLHLSEGMDERERGPGDELVSLAVSCLMCSPLNKGRPADHLLAALLVAQAGRYERPHSPGTRLPSAALFGLLGCPRAAHREFMALDVKSIQHSSLTPHFLLPLLLPVSDREEENKLNKPLLNEILSVHEDHIRDAADTIMTAYAHGSYSKVMEFAAFADRIKRCHSRYSSAAELAILNLRAAAWEGPGEFNVAALEARQQLRDRELADPATFERMRFNEDLSTRPNWFPPGTGACHLGVIEWWGKHSNDTPKGYGCCWWANLQCAESEAHEARTWRESVTLALQQRCLLPSLISGALAACNAPSTAGEQAEISASLAELMRLSRGSVEDTVSIAETAQERVLGPHQELHYCNVALWAVAEGMAELAAGGGSGRLRKFTHALCEWVARAAARASQMLAQSSGSSIVLSGDTISFTNTLLVENFAWLTICLETWISKLKTKKRGKSKKSPQDDQGDSGLQQADIVAEAKKLLLEVVDSAAAVMSSLEQSLQAVLSNFSSSAPGAALTALEAHYGSLWGWSTKISAHACICGVFAEQKQNIEALHAAALDRRRRLKALKGT